MSRLKQVRLPDSKSLYIRKLIYDFLYLGCIGEIPSDASEDIRIVHHCLTCISRNAGGRAEQDEYVLIDVRDCGAAYRFLMAVLAVTPGQWQLTGTPRLIQRPIEELVEALRSIGAEIHPCRDGAYSVSTADGVIPHIDGAHPVSTNENCDCWQIRGKNLHASELTIDCSRSGQFASALWLISQKIGLKKLHVLPENPSSAAYISMTQVIMDGGADLNANRMGDWSAAVYWYAYLLLSQQNRDKKRQNDTSTDGTVSSCLTDVPDSYKLLHLDLRSIQSDAALARWFANWGVVSRQEEDGVVIEFGEDIDIQNDVNESDVGSVDRKDNNQEDTIELDMSQNLDLVPVLACMACIWPKKMVFNGVSNLKYKESDRLKIIQEELSEFSKIELNVYDGIDDNQLVVNPICSRDGACPVSDDDVAIPGRDVPWRVSTNENCSNKSPIAFSFDAHNDHRFVMGFSLFALKGKVQIKGFDCVRKSYPNFKAEGVVAGPDVVG